MKLFFYVEWALSMRKNADIREEKCLCRCFYKNIEFLCNIKLVLNIYIISYLNNIILVNKLKLIAVEINYP